MLLASKILFETPIDGKPLYKRQLELVSDLINVPESVYYIPKEDEIVYQRQQIRLKTLISQLLSPHVCRNIPNEFPGALQVVISKRINNATIANEMVQQILTDLKLKNDMGNKPENKHQSIGQRLRSDFKMGSYIAIISGNPLEIESEENSEGFSIRQIFVDDFLSNINDGDYIPKKYRLLFPLDSTCYLFWKGLKELVVRFIKQNRANKRLIASVKSQFGTTSTDQPELFDAAESVLKEKDFNDLAVSLIKYLNTEGFISVFWHSTPLFSLPTIAINPAETKNSKVYALMRNDKDIIHIHKFANEETVLWRLFVWDRIKTKQFAGKRIDFEIENLADY